MALIQTVIPKKLIAEEKKINYIIPVEAVQERDTDLLILEEIICNSNFTEWLLKKTIKLRNKYELIGAWRSLTQVGLGESDLTFMIRIRKKTFLFFIENKLSSDFRLDQAKRYRLRGRKQISGKECDEFRTILFAPKRYIAGNKDFDFYLEYEEVRDWFLSQPDLGKRASYKAEIMEIAIEKLRRGYTRIINNAVTNFRWAYFEYANKYYPQLRMNKPQRELPKRTGFIRFKPVDLNLKKNEFIIHKHRGDIDLQLRRYGNDVRKVETKYKTKLTGDMQIVPTGKSTSIRITVPKIDIEGNFNDQIHNIEMALMKVEALYKWGKRNL